MRNKIYTLDFKAEAIRQVIETHASVKDVAAGLGIAADPLYVWVRRYKEGQSHSAEHRRLRNELRRVKYERDAMRNLAAKLLSKGDSQELAVVAAKLMEEQIG